MSEQWSVEKAREWLGQIELPHQSRVERLAALLEEVDAAGKHETEAALKLRDEARAEVERLRKQHAEELKHNDPASYSSMVYWREKCYEARAEVERLREALGRVLTEAGLQAHKHGCANKIARPAQWDARLPCAGCQAESALQGR